MTITAAPEPNDDNVKPFRTKPAPSYVQITPDMAKRLLAHNKVNRNLRTGKVNQYARDMEQGNWNLSNDAICIAPDGTLLNGQHRLNAVVKSGRTIAFLVIRNMPSDTMATMDSGAGRTPGDVFRFAGEKHASLVASTLKQLVLIDSGRIYQDSAVQAVSRSEQAEFLDGHPDVRESVAETSKVRVQIDAPPTSIAAAHWLIAQTNSLAFADLFFDKLAHRIGEPEGSAVHAVDNRLREVRRGRQRFEGRNYIYLFLKGWNYYAADKSVSKLLMVPPRGGDFRLPPVARWTRA
jgi:hypothetical protein